MFRSRTYPANGTLKDDGEAGAETISTEAEAQFGKPWEELGRSIQGDRMRGKVPWAVARETSIPLIWIVDRFNLRTAARSRQQFRRSGSAPKHRLSKSARK